MRLNNLQLINFRNYDNLHLNFKRNINLLVGKNGQGKTNIVEAIYMLSFGKSFRTNKDKEIIKFGSENLYIGGNYLKNSSKGLIEVAIGNNKKGIKVNKIHIHKIQELLGNLNVVIFSPEDLKLVKDGPRERRSFIDKEISQIMPKYYNYLVNYNKILIQRNKTLYQSHKLDHPNIISIFVGIALGILAGVLPIAIPGIPVPVKLGLAGGPLIVAILLGRYGPNLRLATYTTNSASLMLRELGIAFFLASVGLAAGDGFLQAFVSGEGFAYMALGLCITMFPLLIVGYVARRFFSLNYLSIVGMMAGTTTDPPALAYAATLSEKNSSAVAYSTVYPLAMFLRILTGQALLLIFWAEL